VPRSGSAKSRGNSGGEAITHGRGDAIALTLGAFVVSMVEHDRMVADLIALALVFRPSHVNRCERPAPTKSRVSILVAIGWSQTRCRQSPNSIVAPANTRVHRTKLISNWQPLTCAARRPLSTAARLLMASGLSAGVQNSISAASVGPSNVAVSLYPSEPLPLDLPVSKREHAN